MSIDTIAQLRAATIAGPAVDPVFVEFRESGREPFMCLITDYQRTIGFDGKLILVVDTTSRIRDPYAGERAPDVPSS